MTTNSAITIFRYNDENAAFQKQIFSCASVYCMSKITPENRGFVTNSAVKIRVPVPLGTKENEAGFVFPGDYVFLGEWVGNEPDRSVCFKVTGVSKNLRGRNPHVRVDAV